MAPHYDDDGKRSFLDNVRDFGIGVVILGVAGIAGFAATRYKVCRPEEIMVKTGAMIKDIHVTKHGIIWPFQKVSVISMVPKTFNFDLHNMSKEKVEFKLPVTFTTAPIHPDQDSKGFERYSKFMNGVSYDEFTKTLGGMIEGEVRVLTASMTIEELFSNKDKFNKDVVERIGKDLDTIGIRILNANIREMGDYNESNKFFEFRKQRAIQTANYDAQRDVAEAQKSGEVGMKEQDFLKRVEIAKFDREAIVSENTQKIETTNSEALLAVAKAQAFQREETAKIEADVYTKLRQTDLEKQLYIKHQEQEIERMRSVDLTKTKVEAETLLAKTDAEARSIKLLAEAHLYQKQQEATGLRAVYEANAQGIGRMLESANGDSGFVRYHMALNANLYQDLAHQGAEAFKGLNPTVTIWNTGDQKTNPINPVIQMAQGFVPLVEGLQNAGIKLPDWMPQMKVKTSTTSTSDVTSTPKEFNELEISKGN